MRCRECPNLVDSKGAHWCRRKGVQISESRLDVERPCKPGEETEERALSARAREIEPEVMRLWNEGLGVYHIVARLKSTYGTVHTILEANGVTEQQVKERAARIRAGARWLRPKEVDDQTSLDAPAGPEAAPGTECSGSTTAENPSDAPGTVKVMAEEEAQTTQPPERSPESVIEATVTYLTAMKREAEAADQIVQAAHAVYGFSPETAEIAALARQIAERRLAALREAS